LNLRSAEEIKFNQAGATSNPSIRIALYFLKTHYWTIADPPSIAGGGSFALLQEKRKKTVDVFFSKVEIHTLFVAGHWLHSKPKPVFRPDSASIRWLSLSTGNQDH
jgi:hypothetical protein